MAQLNYRKVTETYTDGVHKYHFTVDCPRQHDGKPTTKIISVEGPALHAYHNGEGHIQNLFPQLTAEEREMLFQTGFCDKCWDEIFPEGGEEDDT